MTRHENVNGGAFEIVRFANIVVDLVILHVALAAVQRELDIADRLFLRIVISYGVLFVGFVLLPFPARRAHNAALRAFGVVGAASAALGLLAHRLLPGAPAWQTTVLVDLPASVLLVGLALRLMPSGAVHRSELEIEANRAIVVVGAIMLIVYGLHSGGALGWSSSTTLSLLALGTGLLTAHGWAETHCAPAAESVAAHDDAIADAEPDAQAVAVAASDRRRA